MGEWNNLEEAGDKAASNKPRKLKYMLLRLGESLFAVSLGEVREVLGMVPISPLPSMPSYVAGIINLRGKIVSAIHLRQSIRKSSINDVDIKPKKTCVVITEVNSALYGAIVDYVEEVYAVEENMIDHSVESGESDKIFKGIIKLPDGKLAPILNLQYALKIDEIKSLSTQLKSA